MEFSKPRHQAYQVNGELLKDHLMAVRDGNLVFEVNYVEENLTVPILEILRELSENEIYINMTVVYFGGQGTIVWKTHFEGFTIGNFDMCSDYRTNDRVYATVKMLPSSYYRIHHTSVKNLN